MASKDQVECKIALWRLNVLISTTAVLVVSLVALVNEYDFLYLWAHNYDDGLLIDKLNGVVVPLAAFLALSCGILAYLIRKEAIVGGGSIKKFSRFNAFDKILILAILITYCNTWTLRFEGFKDLTYIPERLAWVLVVFMAMRLLVLWLLKRRRSVT